jgi:hypothetical protein
MIHNIHYAATDSDAGVRIHAACTCGLLAVQAFGTVPQMAERFDRLEALAEAHRSDATGAEVADHLRAQLAHAEADEAAARSNRPSLGLYDLPVFGWAWQDDAADLGA